MRAVESGNSGNALYTVQRPERDRALTRTERSCRNPSADLTNLTLKTRAHKRRPERGYGSVKVVPLVGGGEKAGFGLGRRQINPEAGSRQNILKTSQDPSERFRQAESPF